MAKRRNCECERRTEESTQRLQAVVTFILESSLALIEMPVTGHPLKATP